MNEGHARRDLRNPKSQRKNLTPESFGLQLHMVSFLDLLELATPVEDVDACGGEGLLMPRYEASGNKSKIPLKIDYLNSVPNLESVARMSNPNTPMASLEEGGLGSDQPHGQC